MPILPRDRRDLAVPRALLPSVPSVAPGAPAILLVALAVLLSPAVTACGRRAGGPPPAAAAAARHDKDGFKDVEIREDPVKTGIEAGDAGLAGKVRARLAGVPQLHGLAIEVDAEAGRVTLWGHVGRAEDRAAAEQLAHRTPGVAAVNDLIKVDASPDGAGARP
jgi:hypothetical protein